MTHLLEVGTTFFEHIVDQYLSKGDSALGKAGIAVGKGANNVSLISRALRSEQASSIGKTIKPVQWSTRCFVYVKHEFWKYTFKAHAN